MKNFLRFTHLPVIALVASLSACTTTRHSQVFFNNHPLAGQVATKSIGQAAAIQPTPSGAQALALPEEASLLSSTAANAGIDIRMEMVKKKLAQAQLALPDRQSDNRNVKANMNWSSRLLVNSALRKANKVLNKEERVKQEDSVQRSSMNQNVKIGLILMVIGLLLGILVYGPVGGILLVVGLVFLIIGLVNS